MRPRVVARRGGGRRRATAAHGVEQSGLGGIARIADEWLAREQAAATATEEVPLDRRLDALEAKLDALLARTSSG